MGLNIDSNQRNATPTTNSRSSIVIWRPPFTVPEARLRSGTILNENLRHGYSRVRTRIDLDGSSIQSCLYLASRNLQYGCYTCFKIGPASRFIDTSLSRAPIGTQHLPSLPQWSCTPRLSFMQCQNHQRDRCRPPENRSEHSSWQLQPSTCTCAQQPTGSQPSVLSQLQVRCSW
jgi:hypothetical protein